jgi:hypothetical protein
MRAFARDLTGTSSSMSMMHHVAGDRAAFGCRSVATQLI